MIYVFKRLLYSEQFFRVGKVVYRRDLEDKIRWNNGNYLRYILEVEVLEFIDDCNLLVVFMIIIF